MTRLQQEVARKLRSLGCESEFKNETGILNITLNGQPICRIHPDDSYTYLPNDHTTDEQVDAFHAVEKMIDTAKEYITAYENAPQFEIDGIKDYRKLAEFGGVVFGANDMGEQHGFQFSSWFKTYGGTGATMGDYSFDYDYSKQSFTERSGLVNKNRQFTTEQLEDIYRCVAFAKDIVLVPIRMTLMLDAKKYIEKSAAQPFSLDKLAKVLSISKSQLIRLFKKQYNITPYAYSAECKLNIACTLLETSDISIDEIAAKLCFFDRNHLCKNFQKMYNMTPAAYRKNYFNN